LFVNAGMAIHSTTEHIVININTLNIFNKRHDSQDDVDEGKKLLGL
jgi:hypothetical protein